MQRVKPRELPEGARQRKPAWKLAFERLTEQDAF